MTARSQAHRPQHTEWRRDREPHAYMGRRARTDWWPDMEGRR
jgi:hypothetical protein